MTSFLEAGKRIGRKKDKVFDKGVTERMREGKNTREV